MSRINIIVAASDNMVIGKGNDLPWNLPTDLKSFKKITEGSSVIMGRKCWESIPEKFRPLPKRENFVITHNKDYQAPGAKVKHDLLKLINEFKNNGEESDVFVIGGSNIYKETFPHAEKLYLTKVHAHVDGDVYLDGFNESEWNWESESSTIEENGFRFRFLTYKKQ